MRLRSQALLVAMLLPSVAIAWLLADPDANLILAVPVEHVIVVTNVSLLALVGERHCATILFADMRGSTALAERLSPEAVVEVVNEYLGALARCVFDQGGVLDKFTGDGLMSIFGVFQDGTDGARPATRAAVAMRAAVERVSAERASRGEPTARFGVGIHTGDVVLGAIGLPERSDYTALGDTVNTASRLESLTKEYGVEVVLSEAVVSRLTPGEVPVRPLGEAQVRGRSEGVRVFTLAP